MSTTTTTGGKPELAVALPKTPDGKLVALPKVVAIGEPCEACEAVSSSTGAVILCFAHFIGKGKAPKRIGHGRRPSTDPPRVA